MQTDGEYPLEARNPEVGIKSAGRLSGFRGVYTDAPRAHKGPLGSVQILFWLMLHPSAWHNHILRIDPTIAADFNLSGLTRAQWRNPSIRRLLIQALVIWPFVVSLVVGVLLWAQDVPPRMLFISVLAGVLNTITSIVIFSTIVSLGIAVPFCVVWGIAIGTGIGFAPRFAPGSGGMPWAELVFNSWHAIIFGVGIGLTVSVLTIVASNVKELEHDRKSKQIGGLVIGFLVGIISNAFLIGVELGLKFAVNEAIQLGLFQTAHKHPVFDLAYFIICSFVFCLLIGAISDKRRGLFFGIAISLMVVLANRLVSDASSRLVGGMMFGIGNNLFYSAVAVLSFVVAERVAGARAGAIAMGLGSGGGWIATIVIFNHYPYFPTIPLAFASITVGLSLTWIYPFFLYPLESAWNTLIYKVDERKGGRGGHLLHWHSAFWNELQYLRLNGLDDHLMLVMSRIPSEGRAALDYLVASKQRWAAQAVQIELEANNLAYCRDILAVARAHKNLAPGQLEGPASAMLRSFSRVSQDVDAALQQESAYNQRLALSAIEDRIDGLLRELTRSSDRYAARFHPIAESWHQLVSDYVIELTKTIELRQEIDNPYVIGVPLTEQQELFVGRSDITSCIELLLLDRRRPPLLLYGQRRMGKTSLLNNLGRLLPTTIVPFFVDLQGPASQAKDHVGFLYNVARAMAGSALRQRNLVLPSLSREDISVDPFTVFDEWLDEVENSLGQSTALLTLDEFESLDAALTQGRYSEMAVLGMLRHLIQHRPKFKILLSGSHTLDELERWSSYLINVQVIHISYLSEEDARRLIERPVAGFDLRYEPEASQYIYYLTGGHPFLLQLLCAEVVALKNEQPLADRRLALLRDVEAAVPEALLHGIFFFSDIEHNQLDSSSLSLLKFLAAQGEDSVLDSKAFTNHLSSDPQKPLGQLLRRELIIPAKGGYKFQNEMIRRWFIRGECK